MAAPKKLLEINLAHERDTKGTHVFSTNAEGAKITNVYVRKGTFEGDKAPDVVSLVIQTSDATGVQAAK